MTDRIAIHGLHVATSLYRFIEDQVLPAVGVKSKTFWFGFDGIVKDLAPVNMALLAEIRKLKLVKAAASEVLYGDGLKTKHEFETVPSLTSRLGMVDYQLSENTTGVSKTHRANLVMVQQQYEALYPQLQDYYKRLAALQLELEKSNIPYTKSRLNWKED